MSPHSRSMISEPSHELRRVVPPMVVLLCKVGDIVPLYIPTPRCEFHSSLSQSPAVNNYDLTSLRLIMCGAAPLSAELINQLSARIPWASIGQGYGTHCS